VCVTPLVRQNLYSIMSLEALRRPLLVGVARVGVIFALGPFVKF
jgi:hypothetical protein